MDWDKRVYLHVKIVQTIMWITLLLVIALVAIALLLLGIRVFFVKGGKFPNSHIEGNKALKDKGICCAARQDSLAGNKSFKF
jgi:hypothetical protein